MGPIVRFAASQRDFNRIIRKERPKPQFDVGELFLLLKIGAKCATLPIGHCFDHEGNSQKLGMSAMVSSPRFPVIGFVYNRGYDFIGLGPSPEPCLTDGMGSITGGWSLPGGSKRDGLKLCNFFLGSTVRASTVHRA